MILRRIDRLLPGMRIRIKVPEHSRAMVRDVSRIDWIDVQRLAVHLYQEKSDPHPLGFNLFADDMVEVML